MKSMIQRICYIMFESVCIMLTHKKTNCANKTVQILRIDILTRTTVQCISSCFSKTKTVSVLPTVMCLEFRSKDVQ